MDQRGIQVDTINKRPDEHYASTLKTALHHFYRQLQADTSQKQIGIVAAIQEAIQKTDLLTKLRSLSEEKRVAVLQDAFVTDPPQFPFELGNAPKPIYAFCIGAVCLDNQDLLEGLYRDVLKTAADGRGLYAGIKPLGAIRAIDLIYEAFQDPNLLYGMLYDFTPFLLPSVAPEDRDAVRQYYTQRMVKLMGHFHVFNSVREEEEYKALVGEALDQGLKLYPDLKFAF